MSTARAPWQAEMAYSEPNMYGACRFTGHLTGAVIVLSARKPSDDVLDL